MLLKSDESIYAYFTNDIILVNIWKSNLCVYLNDYIPSEYVMNNCLA